MGIETQHDPSAPVLPVELIIPIIEFIVPKSGTSSNADLYSCLFVHRSWTPIVTAAVVRSVKLSSPSAVRSFFNLLRSSRAGKYVKELEIGPNDSVDVLGVIKLCTQLEKLGLDSVKIDQPSFPFPPTLISLTLRSVTLRYISFTPPLVLLPRLKHLTLYKVNAIFQTMSSMEVKTLHKNQRCLPIGSDLPSLKRLEFTQTRKSPNDPIFIIWQRDIQCYVKPGVVALVVQR